MDSSSHSLSADHIYIKFLKRALHVPINAPSLGVRGELGAYPIALFAAIQSVKYLVCLNSGQVTDLVKSALLTQIKLPSEGVRCWYSGMELILNAASLSVAIPYKPKDVRQDDTLDFGMSKELSQPHYMAMEKTNFSHTPPSKPPLKQRNISFLPITSVLYQSLDSELVLMRSQWKQDAGRK